MSGDLCSAIEELCDQLSAAEARASLETLKEALEQAARCPTALTRWALPPTSKVQCLPLLRKCLASAGFVEDGGCFLRSGAGPNSTALQEGLDLVKILLDTMEAPPEAEATMDVDDDLAEALRLSMGDDVASGSAGGAAAGGKHEAKRTHVQAEDAETAKKRERSDAEMAARLSQDEEKRVDVEFERFRGEDVLITEEAVRNINAYCAEGREQYVDPQFPPTQRSLYVQESDGSTWQCFRCQAKTPLPEVPPLPTSEQEAMELEASFAKVKCSACGEPAPFVVKTRYFHRPTQWLRPGVSCQPCTTMAAFEYPGIRDPSSLIEVNCTHYLRCKSTKKTLGQPWVIIRDQPRPEDVQQGALGNCWFAAALSIVASKPDVVSSLFITKDYNPHGAYQLQLFHAGEWRGILIDDLFPTSKISPGKIQGEMIYYSRGGNLSYLSCARHQLWVPLVEKAAAKLAGSYGNLASGTFGEALALFTGFPTERLVLYIPAEQRRARAALRDKKIAERTQMLLRGQTPPEEDEDDVMLEESFRDDLLWSKLLSFREAGYLMGMGCTEAGCEKSKEAILEAGLQAPHAYGILDVREVTDASGKVQRLIQIRNPWGEDAPRTWKGDWGKDSSKWTFELKLQLGVVNRSNVNMYDQMSIFWMSFDDVKEYFAVIDVCRVHDGWEEYRERGWLPSAVGPGEAFDLTVYERTQVDVAMWQEKHITRESAIGASTNVDVGFVVLRRRGDATADFECVEYARRTTEDCCSQEMILEGGYVYRLAPLCFSQMQQLAPRRVTCAVHSSNPTTLQKVPSDWQDLAQATLGAASKGRTMAVSGGVKASLLQERCGYIFGVENATDAPFGLQVDSADSVGMVSSREGGACGCIDLVPPRTRKVVMVLAPRQGVVRTAVSFAYEALPAEAAAWASGAQDLHVALPSLQRQGPIAPSEAILHAAPPRRKKRPLAFRGGHKTPSSSSTSAAQLSLQRSMEEAEAEDSLAEALRLSLQDSGTSSVPQGQGFAPDGGDAEGDEEDELAQAIRLSMQQQQQLQQQRPQPSLELRPDHREASAGSGHPESAPQSRPAEKEAKALQDIVKQRFFEYRKQGLAPNEAAARACRDAGK